MLVTNNIPIPVFDAKKANPVTKVPPIMPPSHDHHGSLENNSMSINIPPFSQRVTISRKIVPIVKDTNKAIMDKAKLKKAETIANSSIYSGVNYLGKWNEFEVFDPIFDDNDPRYIGLPEYILEKDKKFRWSQGNEWQDIMDHFLSHGN